MSKKEPTDRQLVMWWMHEAIARRHGLRPTWVSVQYVINGAFWLDIHEKRAKRLRGLIRDEVDKLQAIYKKKARTLL